MKFRSAPLAVDAKVSRAVPGLLAASLTFLIAKLVMCGVHLLMSSGIPADDCSLALLIVNEDWGGVSIVSLLMAHRVRRAVGYGSVHLL